MTQLTLIVIDHPHHPSLVNITCLHMIFTWTYVICANVSTYVASYVSYISLYFLLKSGLFYVYKRLGSLSVRGRWGECPNRLFCFVPSSLSFYFSFYCNVFSILIFQYLLFYSPKKWIDSPPECPFRGGVVNDFRPITRFSLNWASLRHF